MRDVEQALPCWRLRERAGHLVVERRHFFWEFFRLLYRSKSRTFSPLQPMKLTLTTRVLATALAFAGAKLAADTVDIKNGARIVGKITKIDAGSVVVSTDYAGTITIKQSEVTAIATDAPVAVRLASGTRFDGKVTAGSGGAITIAGTDGTINTTVDKVAATWSAGGKD